MEHNQNSIYHFFPSLLECTSLFLPQRTCYKEMFGHHVFQFKFLAQNKVFLIHENLITILS